MRLTTIILFMAILQVSAGSYAQRITLSERNAKLVSVFDQISKQTGYDFFVSDETLKHAKPVNINIKNAELKTALEKILENQPFEYTIGNKTVLIREKSPSFIDKLIAAFKDIDVRARVIDEKGDALAGAIVRIKETKRFTIANDRGEFYIPKVDENAVLVINYLGYQAKEVRAGAVLGSITMVRISSKLEEVGIVVNTGYQKIKKDQLTGAASTVNEETYKQREAITGNFLESLEGKVPGLVYNGQTGELTIRGVSTFDAVKQPLIVLDGFPTEIDLRTINPNDIVSVSVLRDAAAASIYGVRASNGVIIVETRRGKSGKPLFNLNSSVAFQARPDFSYLKYIRADEFVQLQRENFYISKPSTSIYDLGYYKMNPAQEILFKGPRTGVANPVLSQQQVDQQLTALGAYDNLADYERLFYRQRQTQNINLDVSGGNDISTYFIGMNYIGENLANRGSDNKQFNLNMANTIKFSKRFNFDFRGTYTNSTNKSANTPGYGDFFPYERLTDENGNALPVTLGPGRDFLSNAILNATNETNKATGLYDLLYYPYRELASNSNTVKSAAVKLQGRLNAKITDWLNADLGGNYENQQMLTDRLQTEDAFAARLLINSMALKDLATGKALFNNMPKGNILRKNTQKLINYTLRGQLNFNHNFDGGNHSISGILGLEQKKTMNDGYTTSFFGYDGQSLIVKPINMGALNATVTPAFNVGMMAGGARFSSTNYFGETSTDRRFMSYYGQGTYIYKSKYVATGSFRIDKSNLFGVDPKYRNKPLWSAGLNWRLGEEDFIKKYSWIDQLQLRAATGFNGNVPNSNNGAFLILNSALNTTFSTPLTYNEVLTPENQSLRWETTQNYNFGLDYSFIKNRISGSVDYYIKRTKDVFGKFDADPTTGFNQYDANTASIENRGLELLVNSINLKRNKFEWRTQLTASFNYNKVLAVKATEFANSQQIASATTPVKGLPIGALYSYNYGGLNRMGQPYVLDKAGNQKVLSLFSFGSGIVDVTKDDLFYSGTTTPKYVLGFNNQFSLGAFDLSFLLMYYGGHVMRVEQPNPNNITFSAFPLQGAANFWRKPGDEQNTIIPGYTGASSLAPGYYSSTALYGYQYAAQFVRKADYIRLRDVVLTYRAKAKFLDRAGLRNTQRRFQAQNPFRYTFSGNDIDPDAIDRVSGVRRLEIQPLYSLTFSTNF
ncbi:SusC/RagA family TonB-linked outer membrane protein [Pedobacter africanus]|uniref:TonB-linked SusC/RagA family outer membrane protein n=1 Tax=Pedobacter africanus TaxID=151894 RepID=A0ACC6KW86_9SPHI|nr:SusC/RagA family TonB-linked outer membrane protein [Pedobacter africanus]MDR6783419.1 TonB-linked SusC/RagA family outer membrane protein [Pedobacter africanus]